VLSSSLFLSRISHLHNFTRCRVNSCSIVVVAGTPSVVGSVPSAVTQSEKPPPMCRKLVPELVDSEGGNSFLEQNSQGVEERATLGHCRHFRGHSGMCALLASSLV